MKNIFKCLKPVLALILLAAVFASCTPKAETGIDESLNESSAISENTTVSDESDESEESLDASQEVSQEPLTPAINGNALAEYRIVYSDQWDYNRRAAEFIKEEIKRVTGIELEIIEDDTKKLGNEIAVGETNREISKFLNAKTEKLEFATVYKEGSVALEAEKFVIAAAAYYFVNTYATDALFQAEIPEVATINKPITQKPKSFILLIGDGMGVNQTKLFQQMEMPQDSDFSDGEDYFYGYLLPYYATATTDSLSGLTDSAAAATALSTGYKTTNLSVGRDENGKDLKLITELALELGKSAAVMSTEVPTGATPSSFSGHANSRYDEEDIIASQEISVSKGLELCTDFDFYDAEGLEALEGNITQTLDKMSKNEKGFFIMYEEAHIDKHCHSNDMENAFLAVVRFNQAIGRFMEYAFYNPDTAVIITADHETGALAPDEEGNFVYNSTGHSQANVPVFAFGEGMEVFQNKTVDNVQIPKTIAYFMGEEAFGNPELGGYLK